MSGMMLRVRQIASSFKSIRLTSWYRGVADLPVTDTAAKNVREEVFVSSEQHKIHRVLQMDLEDGSKVTVPPTKWSADHASASEEIVKAEHHKEKTIEEMQKSTIKKVHKTTAEGQS